MTSQRSIDVKRLPTDNMEIFIGYMRADIEPEVLKRNLIALFATIGVDVNTDLVEVMRRPFASHAYVKFRTVEDCRQVLAGFGQRYAANRHSLNLSSITQPGKQLLVEPRQLSSNSSYYMRPPSSTATNDTQRSEDDIDDEPTPEEQTRRHSLGVEHRYVLQETASSSQRLDAISEHGQPIEHASSLSVSMPHRRRLDSSTSRDRCARSATVIDDQGSRMRGLFHPSGAVLPVTHETETDRHACVQPSIIHTEESSSDDEPKSGKNACNSAGGGSGKLRGIPAIPPVPPSIDDSLDIDVLTPATRQPVAMTLTPNVPCTLRQCISAGSNLPREPDTNEQRHSPGTTGTSSRVLGRRGIDTMPSLKDHASMRDSVDTYRRSADVDDQQMAMYTQKAMMSTSPHGHSQISSLSQERGHSVGLEKQLTTPKGRSPQRGSFEELPLVKEEQTPELETTSTRSRSPTEEPSAKLAHTRGSFPPESAPPTERHHSSEDDKIKTLLDSRTISPPFDNSSAAVFHDELHAYILGTKLGNETRHREFKSGQGGYVHKQLRDHVAKYAVAFLNSEGGTLIIGVNDAGVVIGISINQHLEDILRQKIDTVIKDISPQVFPSMYRVNFCPVEDLTGTTLEDVKVLEIVVRPSAAPQLYQTPRGDVYIRRDGSVQGPLKATDIQEWTRMVMRNEYREREVEIEKLREQHRMLTKQLETATMNFDQDTKALREKCTMQRATKEELEAQLAELRQRMSQQRKSKTTSRVSGLCILL